MASKIVALGQPAQPATIGQPQALLDAFTAVTATREPPGPKPKQPGRRCAARCSTTRRPNAIGSGRPTSASSKQRRAGSGICAVIDYAAKHYLAVGITPTGRSVDALACLDVAVVEAEGVLGLHDLRDDRGELDGLETIT